MIVQNMIMYVYYDCKPVLHFTGMYDEISLRALTVTHVTMVTASLPSPW